MKCNNLLCYSDCANAWCTVPSLDENSLPFLNHFLVGKGSPTVRQGISRSLFFGMYITLPIVDTLAGT